ncbi:MAG: membrane protein insertion efficiency factor YidD [Vampirovibrionales bacterium]|nr:membrane protein insertion efficiency factor YidD [Vampirovibrionales bacterium]
MSLLEHLITSLCRVAIWLYRVTLGWMLPPRCRFVPSCSRYADEAFRCHGFLQGLKLMVSRLLRCHPWHPGGYDPVPQARVKSAKASKNSLKSSTV